MEDLLKKWVVIGLGGTGSSIVNRLKELAPEYSKDQVVFAGFDTDRNYIKKIDNITIVQTSQDQSINEYLKNNEINSSKWFPSNINLGAWKIIDGATQFRIISRLGLRSALNSDLLTDLKEKINRLISIDGKKEEIQILIVSSIAGGTGAGIVLQIPNLIRSFFPDFGYNEHTTKGVFLMPDIFIPHIDDDQQESRMRANAYSVFRELNAMNVLSQWDDRENLPFTMDIDYFDNEPRFKTEDGAKFLPYNYIFVIDRDTLDNKVMNTVEEAIELAAQNIYQYIFSPISSEIATEENNLKSNLITYKNTKQLASFSTARLVYPYEDNLEYITFKVLLDIFDKQWGKFDNDFYNKKRIYEAQKEFRSDLSEPNLREVITKGVESDLKTNSGNLSFLIEELTNPKTNSNIVEDYFTQLKKWIKRFVDKSKELNRNTNRTLIDTDTEESLRKNQNVVDIIEDIEANRKSFINSVDPYVKNYKNKLAEAIINLRITGENPNYKEILKNATSSIDQGSHNILTVLLGGSLDKKEFIHPLSARYVVSKLIKLIDEELEVAENLKKKSVDKINNYEEELDDKDTTDIKETAIDLFPQNNRRSILNFFRNNRNEEGITKFKRIISEQVQALKNLYQSSLEIEVLKQVKNELLLLEEAYNELFSNLHLITKKLNNNIEALKNKNIDDTFIEYILGSASDKEDLYKKIKEFNLQPASLNDEINQNLLVEGSKRVEIELNKKSNIDLLDLSELINTTVFETIKNNIKKQGKNILDINIIEALFEKEKNENQVRERLVSVFNRAQPPIKFLHDTRKENFKEPKLNYWGLSIDSIESLKGRVGKRGVDTFFDVIGMGARPKVVKSNEYSPYELVSYNAVYGLAPPYLQKINEYKKNYDLYVENLKADGLPNRSINADDLDYITPHINIKWHITLPQLTSELERQENVKINKGLLLALVFGKINLEEDENREIHYREYPTHGYITGRNITFEGNELTDEDSFSLYLKAHKEPDFVYQYSTELDDELEKSSKNIAIRDLERTALDNTFVRRLSGTENRSINILDFIDAIRIESESESNEEVLELLETIDLLINDYIRKIKDQKKKGLIRKSIKERIYNNSQVANLDSNIGINHAIQNYYIKWTER